MFRWKKFDALSLCFVLALAAILAGGGYLAFDLGWLHSSWELAGVLAVVVLVVIFALVEGAPASPPQLTDVIGQKAHGRARDATEAETLASLGQAGDAAGRPKREFPN
jgi:hypothetical protein